MSDRFHVNHPPNASRPIVTPESNKPNPEDHLGNSLLANAIATNAKLDRIIEQGNRALELSEFVVAAHKNPNRIIELLEQILKTQQGISTTQRLAAFHAVEQLGAEVGYEPGELGRPPVIHEDPPYYLTGEFESEHQPAGSTSLPSSDLEALERFASLSDPNATISMREYQKLLKENEELHKKLSEWTDTRKDTERLDWLQSDFVRLIRLHNSMFSSDDKNVRDHIDALKEKV